MDINQSGYVAPLTDLPLPSTNKRPKLDLNSEQHTQFLQMMKEGSDNSWLAMRFNAKNRLGARSFVEALLRDVLLLLVETLASFKLENANIVKRITSIEVTQLVKTLTESELETWKCAAQKGVEDDEWDDLIIMAECTYHSTSCLEGD
jgi:hypothetical protein